MSEILQAGQHPDADQLTAFLEHILPAHEQQQTLAHLAACPACRQIVALSLPPAGESAISEPAVRPRWFPGWHPAWAGIPALAALLIVILLVRHSEKEARQMSPAVRMADAREPASPPVAGAPPEVALDAAPLVQHAHPGRRAAGAQQPAPVARERQGLASGASAGAGGTMGGILGGIGTGLAQPTTPPEPFAASKSTVAVSAPAADRAQAVLSSPGPLPSRLAILSMASRGNQRLAIDTDHQLFVSNDEGRNWAAVLSPWRGRAVAVALISHISSGNGVSALKMSSRPAAGTGGGLSGTITDPTGAMIPGATVFATNSAAEMARSVTSDDHGQFRMENLVPGSYQIEAQANGFETQSFAAEVAPAQQAVADVTLRVGSAAQSVTVEASSSRRKNSPLSTNVTARPPASQTPSRFELTTNDGERWMSTDGQSWTRE